MHRISALTMIFFIALPVAAGSAQDKPFSADDIDRLLKNNAPMKPASSTIEERLRNEIESCWNMPVVKRGAILPEIKISVDVGRDGSLLKNPRVLKSGKSALGKQLAKSAVRAVERCAPFNTVKDNPKSYEKLRTIILNFQPSSL